MVNMAKRLNIILIVHNVRSAHNVGSLLRTAEGLGVEKVYLTGYTPYPEAEDDERLPHIWQKMSRQIHKTALGAEKILAWEHHEDIKKLLGSLAQDGYQLAALEQTAKAISLRDFQPSGPVALIVGNEVDGVDKETLCQVSVHLQILMLGSKESFNVAVAAAMALYHLRYMDKEAA